MAKTAVLIGSTGLIGGHILDLLQQDPFFTSIRLLVRRPVAFDHPKVQVVTLDFSNEQAYRDGVTGSDVLFCAVGTTQKKVKGDQAAYRKVDYDIPVAAARYGAEAGCRQMLLVSSVGANSKSNNFYLKLKGEVEDAVQATSIGSIGVFRPSVLLGNRKESRPAEHFSQVLMNAFSFLIPSKYKPIAARDVARAMVQASKEEQPGFHIYEYREIQELIKR